MQPVRSRWRTAEPDNSRSETGSDKRRERRVIGHCSRSVAAMLCRRRWHPWSIAYVRRDLLAASGLPCEGRLGYSARQAASALQRAWKTFPTARDMLAMSALTSSGGAPFPTGLQGPVPLTRARVAELVDAADLKSAGLTAVPVRFRPRAPSRFSPLIVRGRAPYSGPAVGVSPKVPSCSGRSQLCGYAPDSG